MGTTHRALSKWVMLINGPDEYVRLTSPTGRPTSGSLAQFIEKMGVMVGRTVSQLQVRSWPFAYGGPELAPHRGNWNAGEVIASSRHRAPDLDGSMHTPFLNPESCTCAGPHTCTAEKGYTHGNATEIPDDLVVTHHYVEMFPWYRGRCNRLHLGMYERNHPDG